MPSSKRDYYEVLGIERGASADEIKKAYRKLALQYHPDRNPGDAAAEESFKEATQAYEILRDGEKRSRYDQFGHQGVDPNMGGGPGDFGGFDISDALRAFMRDFGGFGNFEFGGSSRGATSGPRRGQDLQIQLKLSLEEVATGVERTLRVKVLSPCGTCEGSGAKPGTSSDTCQTCGGQGQVRQVQRSILGQFVNIAECPDCHGDGTILRDRCGDCRGEGRRETTESIKVRIPAGVTSGNYIPLRGKGNVGIRGGPRGDIIVLIEEIEHPRLERHGDDVLSEIDIAFDQAVLGGSVQVATLDGKVKMNIPAGTPSGKIFRLRGKGIPHLRGSGAGDQLVRVHIHVPKKLNKEARRILEEIRGNDSFRPSGKS